MYLGICENLIRKNIFLVGLKYGTLLILKGLTGLKFMRLLLWQLEMSKALSYNMYGGHDH